MAATATVATAVSQGAHQVVDQLISAAFDRPRDRRSDAYKQGARALLISRVSLATLICNFQPGSVEFDAFFAGVEEGRAIWQNAQRRAAQ